MFCQAKNPLREGKIALFSDATISKKKKTLSLVSQAKKQNMKLKQCHIALYPIFYKALLLPYRLKFVTAVTGILPTYKNKKKTNLSRIAGTLVDNYFRVLSPYAA